MDPLEQTWKMWHLFLCDLFPFLSASGEWGVNEITDDRAVVGQKRVWQIRSGYKENCVIWERSRMAEPVGRKAICWWGIQRCISIVQEKNYYPRVQEHDRRNGWEGIGLNEEKTRRLEAEICFGFCFSFGIVSSTAVRDCEVVRSDINFLTEKAL